MEQQLGANEARKFIKMKVYLEERDLAALEYESGEFWFAGDMLFVSCGENADPIERKLKIFNLRFVKNVSLIYGI